MRYVVIIPARYHSTRLPGKPLLELCGIPMIVRTYKQCAKAVPSDCIYVATDDQRIIDKCQLENIKTILTSSDCLTGTDRVADAARKVDADVYINLQGDEPVFNPNDLSDLVTAANAHPNKVLNGYCPITEESHFRSGSIPKVVTRPDGQLLYMSRAPVPTNKASEFVKAWRQVCAYAFPKAALEAFSQNTSKSPLEAIEDIEILRFLELGWNVQMIPMSNASVAVDNPEDIPVVEAAIRDRAL